MNNRLNKSNLKRNLLLTAVLGALLIALLGGTTWAWLADASGALQNTFTAGTVEVDLDPDKSTIVTIEDGCQRYTFHLKNIGTKSSYLRVKAVRSEITVKGETAWAFGEKTFQELGLSSRWGWVFNYTIGGPAVEQKLWAGAGQNDITKGEHVGFVIVDEQEVDSVPHLVVRYLLFNEFTMSEAHLYVGRDYPQTAAPGQFPYAETASYNLLDGDQSYYFKIPLTELGQPGEQLKIAAHGVVADKKKSDPYLYQPSSLCPGYEDTWFWHREEGVDQGYWYYWDYDRDTLKKLVAGEEITLCLDMCPLGSDTRRYNFYIEIESVQSTHGAVKTLWPERVWINLPDP